MNERELSPGESILEEPGKHAVGAASYHADGTLFIGGESLRGLAELREVFEKAAEDPEIPGPMRILIDARGTRIQTDHGEISRLARLVATNIERFGPAAAIVVSDGDQFELARIGAANADAAGLKTRIFFSVREALSWLNEV